MNKNGKFVISLDFELLWGVRDILTIDDYGESILAVRQIMPRMLDMFTEFDVHSTFATVGFLFASNKDELVSYCPDIKPQYKDPNLSPYNGHFDEMEKTESEDKYHYAAEMINLLKKYPAQEIATHTFSHYYCKEEGQTIDDFRRDIDAAVKIAEKSEVKFKSLVFLVHYILILLVLHLSSFLLEPLLVLSFHPLSQMISVCLFLCYQLGLFVVVYFHIAILKLDYLSGLFLFLIPAFLVLLLGCSLIYILGRIETLVFHPVGSVGLLIG